MSEKKTPVFPVMSKAVKSLFENGPPSANDIENFQEKFWEQMVASFSPALKVIDIHDISRHSVLWNINDRLLEVVKSRIQEYPVGEDKNKNLWKRLLTNASSFIHHQYMRGTIMMVLSKMPNIRDKYISLIVNHEALYDDAPLPVLRQIWMSERNSKFKEEVMKIIRSYQSAFSNALLEAVLASVACSSADTLPILFWAPRRRRRDPHLLRLIEMIGDNTVLYEKTLQILRNEHVRHQQLIGKSATRRVTLSSSEMPNKPSGKRKEESPAQPAHQVFIPPALLPTMQSLAASVLCTLRFDLLMGLNEAKSEALFQSDKIHRFVWGMDACIRNKEIDRRHAKDLVTSFGGYQSRSNSGRRPSTSALVGEVGLDQDTSEDWAPDAEEKGSRKKSTRSAPKSGDKRLFSEVDSDSETAKTTDQENRKLKIDLQMVCRDPWVVFTICSTLLKIVIKNGLSEDKLPRNLPDVPFLVNLLMRGLENDLFPPEMVISRDISVSKGESKSKRLRKQQSEATQPMKLDPATALIVQVLPAAAQLHLTTWRNQLCESIRGTANQIWSKTSQTATPSQWQKRLDSCLYTPLTVSPAYLAHPVGHLFIQYHALFALERREWSVLRALLKAAVSAAQAKPTKVAPRPGKISSIQTPTSICQPTVGFRWRPECLQAIAIGIASLPTSSEEPVKGSRNRVSASDDRPGVMDKSSSNVIAETPSVASTSVTGGGTTSPSVVTDSVLNNASSIVTRAELASLLRNTLPLQSDLQLLVLAQCAKLMPMTPTTPTTPGSAGAATPMPNFFAASGDMSVVPRGSNERERMMNALSRHIEFAVNQEGEDNPVISPTAANTAVIPGGFKSVNPKVLEAFEWLKKNMERSSSSGMIPMMGTSKPACGKPMTTLSPLGGSVQPSQYGMASPSRLMPPPTRFAPRTARYAPNAFPMATPLTNPGLSMPPPPPPASGGQIPLSPLADYRPLSPGVCTSSSSSLGGSGSSYPTYATPLAADVGEGGLVNYAGSLSPTGGDLSRYAAAPTENRSPSPPLPLPQTMVRHNSPPSP